MCLFERCLPMVTFAVYRAFRGQQRTKQWPRGISRHQPKCCGGVVMSQWVHIRHCVRPTPPNIFIYTYWCRVSSRMHYTTIYDIFVYIPLRCIWISFWEKTIPRDIRTSRGRMSVKTSPKNGDFSEGDVVVAFSSLFFLATAQQRNEGCEMPTFLSTVYICDACACGHFVIRHWAQNQITDSIFRPYFWLATECFGGDSETHRHSGPSNIETKCASGGWLIVLLFSFSVVVVVAVVTICASTGQSGG